eukprot:scaffold23992_cov95-Isochrysis_galbana.AAC.3
MAPTRPAEDIDAQLGEGTTAEADGAAVGVCGSPGRRRAPCRRLEALSPAADNARQRPQLLHYWPRCSSSWRYRVQWRASASQRSSRRRQQHLDNKCSLREAGRQVGVHHNTVENWVTPIRRLRLLLNPDHALLWPAPGADSRNGKSSCRWISRISARWHLLPDCRQPPRQTPVAAHPHGRSWAHPRQPPTAGPGAAAMRRGVGGRRGWRGPRLGGKC